MMNLPLTCQYFDSGVDLSSIRDWPLPTIPNINGKRHRRQDGGCRREGGAARTRRPRRKVSTFITNCIFAGRSCSPFLRYPDRPRNHSTTLPFHELYENLFDPLNNNKKKPTGPVVPRRRVGPNGPSSRNPHEIRHNIVERFISRWRN